MIMEKDAWSINGYLALIIIAVTLFVGLFSFMQQEFMMALIFFSLGFILSAGITFVQPNQAVIVQFLGKYIGTFRHSGIVMFIPFSTRKKVSLRVRAYQGKTMHISDGDGLAQEIAMMLVFKIVDAAKAVFDVDNIDTYIDIQSELALRQLLATEPNVKIDDRQQEMVDALKEDMRERLYIAGIELMEIRLFPVNPTTIRQEKQNQLSMLIQKLLDYFEADMQTTKMK